jgi:hypothetical protein
MFILTNFYSKVYITLIPNKCLNWASELVQNNLSAVEMNILLLLSCKKSLFKISTLMGSAQEFQEIT